MDQVALTEFLSYSAVFGLGGRYRITLSGDGGTSAGEINETGEMRALLVGPAFTFSIPRLRVGDAVVLRPFTQIAFLLPLEPMHPVQTSQSALEVGEVLVQEDRGTIDRVTWWNLALDFGLQCHDGREGPSRG